MDIDSDETMNHRPWWWAHARIFALLDIDESRLLTALREAHTT